MNSVEILWHLFFVFLSPNTRNKVAFFVSHQTIPLKLNFFFHWKQEYNIYSTIDEVTKWKTKNQAIKWINTSVDSFFLSLIKFDIKLKFTISRDPLKLGQLNLFLMRKNEISFYFNKKKTHNHKNLIFFDVKNIIAIDSRLSQKYFDLYSRCH